MQKKCLKCGEFKDEKNFPISADKIHKKNSCYACIGKKERAKLKYDMLQAYGFKCQCCGEDNPYFLTLDHVNNDGHAARDKYNEQQIYRLARREGWPKDRYQLLCMNCNFAKGHYKECPHKLGITSEEALKRLEELVKGIGREHVQYNTSNINDARASMMNNAKQRQMQKVADTMGISLEQLMILAEDAKGVS